MTRILSVASVEVSHDNNKPPHLIISAQGKVTTTGWSNPSLDPAHYFTIPEDGIQDFDFDATPPKGIAGQVISPIAVTVHLPVDPANYWGPGKPLKGVRIHAQQNTEEAEYKESEITTFKGGDGNGWPWLKIDLQKGSLDDPISSLPGHIVRVYHTGDFITLDYAPHRVNLELQKDHSVIQRVWFG